MSELDEIRERTAELRSEYIDAAAKAFVYRMDYEDRAKPMDYYTVQHAEVLAARALLDALKEVSGE